MTSDASSVAIRSRRQLTPAQRAIYASQRRYRTSPLQNTALLAHIDGAVDVARLSNAFASVVDSSEVLRSQFVAVGDTGEIDVRIAPEPPARSEIVSLARHDTVTWATSRSRRMLDLEQCAYDSVIIIHEDGTTSWFLNLHHVVTDATSSALVFEATAAVYDGQSVESEAYYLRPQDDTATSTRQDRATEYWADRLPTPRLGQLYHQSDRRDPKASRIPVPVHEATFSRASAMLGVDYQMLTESLGWSALITTATALYLHRLSGSVRFSIGMSVHNRTTPELRSLIGPLIEVFPVDIEILEQDTHRSLHARVSKSVLTTLRHAQTNSSPPSDFDAIVNVIPGRSPRSFGQIPSAITWLDNGAVDPDHLLRVHLTEYQPTDVPLLNEADRDTKSHYELSLDINDDVATEAQRRIAGDHFLATLDGLVDEPDAAIGHRSLCTSNEIERLAAWESTPDFASDPTHLATRLHQALARNDEIVLRDSVTSLTGRDLWRWVVGFADSLASSGVRAGVRVGVDVERSIEAVVAIYAIILSGGSFVPFDSTQPVRRRNVLTGLAGCERVLTSRESIRRLRGALSDEQASDRAASLLSQPRPLDDEAYVLFTSGSTGLPKGVPITHRGIASYIRFAESAYFEQDPAPVAPLFGSLAFDLTLTSLFAPILRGGRLSVIAADGAAALSAIAETHDLTWCKATPSHLEILVRLLPPEHSLATLVVGGEAFTSRLATQLFDHRPQLQIFNEYGPTEAVVGCMIHRASIDAHGLDVPIGRPAPGVELRVVDRHNQRVPLGVAGELLIATRSLTAGYLDADEKSAAESFLVENGHQFYRSGDLVRLVEHQGETQTLSLVYLGRIDDQVKVGGIRLEPAEVQAALERHPMIEHVAVGLWSPSWHEPNLRCIRCGLPDNVPGIEFDLDGVCDTCLAFDAIEPVARTWFKTVDDLTARLSASRHRATGDYDCLHLLSGGKDSTYVLYRLVELGFRPYVLTLDNGYISEAAKANVRSATADLGLDHEFATTDAMNEIFRDSLATYSNVCNGCYKTLYTLATNRAVELGIPTIVTGLSRGQLFETRLIPQQFAKDRFDPDAIDRAVISARKRYHRAPDAANRLLDTSVFADDDLFESIEYLDFYRYTDVELSDVLDYLAAKTSWKRPPDTGRSSNCLINVAGIHTHIVEQGYHNYAIPYAWDVRLRHKTRDEAIAELDDDIDIAAVGSLLADIDYRPSTRSVLAAWIELVDDARVPSPSELRSFLADVLPAPSIPAAFVVVVELPLTSNGKLDVDALPAPQRTHRPAAELTIGPTTETEETVLGVWERVLHIEPIGLDDDFFALGGDSLGALQMIMLVGSELGAELSEALAFANLTPRELAAAIGSEDSSSDTTPTSRAGPVEFEPTPSPTPKLSAGEQSVLLGQRLRPSDTMYNVARLFEVNGSINAERFERALRTAAARHQPLRWTYGRSRRPLDPAEAVEFAAASRTITRSELPQAIEGLQTRPFDLGAGPMLRCLLQPLANGATAILFAAHHVCCDHESFDRLIAQIDQALDTDTLPPLEVDYASFCEWQASSAEADRAFWLQRASSPPPAKLHCVPADAGLDGYITLRADLAPDEIRAGSGSSPLAKALVAASLAVRPFHDGQHVEVCLVSSTRTHPAGADLFGYLLNPIPIAVDCDPARSVGELAADVTAQVGTALPHRAFPFADIVADRRAASKHAPTGQVLVAYHDAEPMRLNGFAVRQGVAFNGDAVTDATFFVLVRHDVVDVGIEYSGTSLGEEVARSMLRAFNGALATAVRAPRTLVAETPLRFARSVASGGSLAAAPLVLDQIRQHMQTLGKAPAVECDGEQLSWRDLGQRAHVISSRLAMSGVTAGDRVVINLPRSVDLVASILAVQNLGAAYVPVDPSYPEHRVQLIVDAADPRAVITGAHQPGGSAHLVIANGAVDGTTWPEAIAETAPATEPLPAVTPEHDAYVIFTSGSTGAPHGVPVTHSQLAASTHARSSVYADRPTRFAMLSSAAFDSSIVGLFWTLATGGTVCLPPERIAHDIDGLAGFLGSNDLSHMLCVPTLYQAILGRRAGKSKQGWPRQVIVAGEACPPAVVADHFATTEGSRLTNEYGPTEATVWATAHHCDAADVRVPIGPPIPGVWIAVLDEHDQPVAEGAVGELVIGGATISRGYLNDPALTRERFASTDEVDSLRDVGGRFFRTGDRAVITRGVAHFVGRADAQLNLGGSRVEPTDVELALCGIPGIEAALVAIGDPRTSDELMASVPHGVVASLMMTAARAADPHQALIAALREHDPSGAHLIAHLESTADIELAQLRSAVAALLPPTMRPTIYSFHDRLPRTPNGKLDRAAAHTLPIIAAAGDLLPTASSGPSETGDDAVRRVTEIFAKVLRNPAIGPHDSFTDMGGHSLLLIELLVSIEDAFQVELDASVIFSAQTPAAIADHLVAGSEPSNRSYRSFVIPIQPLGDKTPLLAIHNLGTDCEYWRPLAAELGTDQPLFGLGDPHKLEKFGTVYDPKAAFEIDEIAAAYVEEINQLVPTGDVAVIGLCGGAVSAYEVAQQLTAAGRTVQLLAIINDWHAPFLDKSAEAIRDPGARQAALLSRLSNVRSKGFGYFSWAIKDAHTVNSIRRQVEILALAAIQRLGINVPHRLQVRNYIERGLHSLHNYRYEPYDGQVAIYRGADDPNLNTPQPGNGWKTLLANATFTVTPGQGTQMMYEPNVHELAMAIATDLERTATSTGEEALRSALVDALHHGRLTALLPRYLDQAADASSLALVRWVDRVCSDIAASNRLASDQAAALLRAGGVTATAASLPERMMHHVAVVLIEDSGEDAAAALVAVGYEPTNPALEGDPSGTDFVRSTGDTSTRVRLVTPAAASLAPVDASPARDESAPTELGGFLGTPTGLIAPLLEFAGATAGELVVDVGCGDGRVLVTAAKAFACRGLGIELDPALAQRARSNIAAAGLTHMIEIVEGDADSLRDKIIAADVVFAFLPPDGAMRFVASMIDDLAAGARLIAHEQLAVPWTVEPDQTELVLSAMPGTTPASEAEPGLTVASLWHGRSSP